MLLDREKSVLVLVDVQEKLTPLVRESEKLIKHAKWLLSLAEKLNIPLMATEQYPSGLGPTLLPLMMPSLTTVIEKNSFSCCGEPTFQKTLQEIKKPQVLLIGIETHVCILQTALDLKTAGYDVFVAVDTVSSRHEIDHKTGLKRMRQAGVVPMTREMVFFEWLKKAATSEFKSLSQHFLKSQGD